MNGLSLSVERPVLLSTAAREKVESARKRLRLDQGIGKDAEKSDEEKIDILERAHEDATSTAR